jgi:DNA replication protein DnaC
MGWQMAATAVIGAATAKQQGKIGKFNQAVSERNAKVAEAEAAQIEKKTEFDIARFDESYQKLVGQAEVAFAKSGVVSGTGTAYRIAAANAKEKYMQENIMRYNSKVAQSKKIEEANFAKISGQMAREQSRLAQIKTIGSTGTSLLNMGNFGGGQSYNKIYTGFGQSGYGRDRGDIM